VQQFVQSATNDYQWNAAKKLTGAPVSNLAATLDAQRARAARRWAPPNEAGGDALV
jgi:cytochrome c553